MTFGAPPLWAVIFALCSALASSAEEPAIRRADVALSLVRFEQALAGARLDAEGLARVNRGFDRATLAYFAGDARGTLRQLDALTLELIGRSDDPRARAAIRLRVRIDPPRAVQGGAAAVRSVPLYGMDGPPIGGTARLASDAARWTPVDLTLDGPGEAPVAAEALGAPGHHRLELELAGGLRLEAGSWSVVDRDAGELRRELEARLDRLAPGEAPGARARACARARLRLLAAVPDEEDTAQVFLDPCALARELMDEVETLEAGRDPYRGRPGEQWRALDLGGRAVPYRVLAPPAALAAGRPLPLLIAFHGFQGDENMFRWAYGRGRLGELAEAEGWLLCTPRTEPFMRGPEAFDRLLEALASDYPVDRRRVFLLGHSMGSQAVAMLLQRRAQVVAGSVLFSGASPDGEVPTLTLRGELDPMGGFGRRAPGPDARLLPGWGHTLVVGPHLGEALSFLRGLPPRRVYY